MKFALTLLSCASAQTIPGGYMSLSGSSLSRGAGALIPNIVSDIKALEIPGVNKSLFWVEPIHFDDVTIGSYDVSVVPGQGVQVSLTDMSNQLAHTRIFVRDLLGLVKCTGEIWGSATGAKFTAMNTLELDSEGNGKVVTVSPPRGFDVGTAELHHKMDQIGCEAIADVLHLVDSAVIDIIGNQLEQKLVPIVSDLVDLPLDDALRLLEKPPALGFGREKFQLDNTFLSVDYDNNRISHYNKAEFKSVAHPKESALIPPKLSPAGERDLVLSYSDFAFNTLFEALYAEHVGESQVKIPFVKTLFDKECPFCPIVIATTFEQPLAQTFEGGHAAITMTNAKMEVGALNSAGSVLPMVTLSVNAAAGVDFTLEQTEKNAAINAVLSLDEFSQDLLVSHVGDLDMSDLTRDMKLLITSLLDTINKDVPALPVPVIAGVKLDNEQFVLDNREFRLEADFIAALGPSSIVV